MLIEMLPTVSSANAEDGTVGDTRDAPVAPPTGDELGGRTLVVIEISLAVVSRRTYIGSPPSREPSPMQSQPPVTLWFWRC
jgi:hypothetical protein